MLFKLRQNLLVGAAGILCDDRKSGMDSSRSGLLSTILMTLPLIVVPAVALLRPPGQAGVAGVDVAASDDESGLHDVFFDELDGFDAVSSEALKKDHPEHSSTENNASQFIGHERNAGHTATSEDDIFDSVSPPEGSVGSSFSDRTAPSPKVQTDPFMDVRVQEGPATENRRTPQALTPPVSELDAEVDRAKPDVREVISQLNALGALKTVWFDAGEKTPVGLAVFFRGARENTRIRFEFVGSSREACAEHVLAQVIRWQQQNPEQ